MQARILTCEAHGGQSATTCSSKRKCEFEVVETSKLPAFFESADTDLEARGVVLKMVSGTAESAEEDQVLQQSELQCEFI